MWMKNSVNVHRTKKYIEKIKKVQNARDWACDPQLHRKVDFLATLSILQICAVHGEDYFV